MELARQQKLIARLAIDRAFRETFFADPARVAANEGLTGAAEALVKIHHEQLRQLTRVLRRRRMAQVGEQLPLTRKALGSHFADLFRNYAVTPPPGTRPFEDALGFARHLGKQASSQGLDPSWALSLARYEAAHLEATWTNRRLVVCFLPHGVKKLAALLATGDAPPGSYRRLTLAVWWRATSKSRLAHRLI
jgi:hypothetical protein